MFSGATGLAPNSQNREPRRQKLPGATQPKPENKFQETPDFGTTEAGFRSSERRAGITMQKRAENPAYHVAGFSGFDSHDRTGQARLPEVWQRLSDIDSRVSRPGT